MPDLPKKLRIKYQLPEDPTDEQIREWVARADRYRREYLSDEDAGRRAAQDIFQGYSEYLYKAEADTIEVLLDEARKR